MRRGQPSRVVDVFRAKPARSRRGVSASRRGIMRSRGRPTARASCRWTQPRCPTSWSRADALRRPPASSSARSRTVRRKSRHSKQLSSFFPLFERRCCTPSPPVILDAPDPTLAELDLHSGDRPQVADRGRCSGRFSAPGPLRAPAALPRRVTAADIMCSVVPAGAELRHVEFFGGSTAGAPTIG